MIKHREEHLDLCAAIALGCIDPAERLVIEEHLAGGCPECERCLAECGQGVRLLAVAAAPAAPHERVRQSVLDTARAEARETAARPAGRVIRMPRRARVPRFAWASVGAAAALVLVSVWSWREVSRLQGELDGVRSQVAAGERALAEEREWAAMLARPGARVAELSATPAGLALPRVRAVFDPASRRAVVAFEGLVTPAGSDFELWAILHDGPRSLGVVRADASGRAVVRVPDAGDPAALSAFAVSLEKEGGSTNPRQPGGPVVLVGSLGG